MVPTPSHNTTSRSAERMSGWSSTASTTAGAVDMTGARCTFSMRRICRRVRLCGQHGGVNTRFQDQDKGSVMAASLARRIAAAREVDPMEFDQSKVRFAIETIVLGYLLAAFLWDRTLTDVELLIVVWMIIVLSLAAADFVWMLLRPGINHLRRRAKVVMDMAAVSVTMVLGGEIGALLFAIFPWVIIGNGFRFGRWYLHYSQIVGAAGFACVLLFSEFWRSQLVIGVSCMFVVLGVPWSAAALISRLHAASQRLQEARSDAEAANIAKTKFLAAASHDLRQPMQALSMYASVLEQRVSDPDAARVVQGVQLSCRTLEQLFDGLLDISKIESGVIRPSVVDFP